MTADATPVPAATGATGAAAAGPGGDAGWADRAAGRSPIVQRSRDRSIAQTRQIVDAAIELIGEKGSAFTIQELAKQAHIALQTFYRHFAGKDELLLAVIEQTISESMVALEASARHLDDPLDRLRYYLTSVLSSLDDRGLEAQRRFITAEHYRLHQLFPDELQLANRAFTDLLVPEIEAAAAAGRLAPNDVDADAWFMTELAMATYHHYSYATSPVSTEELSERLWRFRIAGLGGGHRTAPPTRATGGPKSGPKSGPRSGPARAGSKAKAKAPAPGGRGAKGSRSS
jgi:AcrR family transcriptional regulator